MFLQGWTISLRSGEVLDENLFQCKKTDRKKIKKGDPGTLSSFKHMYSVKYYRTKSLQCWNLWCWWNKARKWKSKNQEKFLSRSSNYEQNHKGCSNKTQSVLINHFMSYLNSAVTMVTTTEDCHFVAAFVFRNKALFAFSSNHFVLNLICIEVQDTGQNLLFVCLPLNSGMSFFPFPLYTCYRPL